MKKIYSILILILITTVIVYAQWPTLPGPAPTPLYGSDSSTMSKTTSTNKKQCCYTEVVQGAWQPTTYTTNLVPNLCLTPNTMIVGYKQFGPGTSTPGMIWQINCGSINIVCGYADPTYTGSYNSKNCN